MNNLLQSAVLSAALFLGTSMVNAQQIKLPPASSSQSITQGLGISKVSVSYQRPSLKDRKIFGELVPFGQVWRTGANNATAITFESEVIINETKVPAGTYGLFTIPTEGEWTIILNKNAEQWGAYTYKESEDLFRFKAKPSTLAEKVETFTITFDDITDNSAKLSLAWENTKVSFAITVDQNQEIVASIDAAMQGEKKPYFQAAQYYFAKDLDINKAAEWIKLADEGNTKAPHIKYWKSKILLKAGDKVGATKAAEEGIEIAKAANNEEYVKLNTAALNAAK